MSEIKTGVTEFLLKANFLPERRKRLIQRFAIWRMRRKGLITEQQAEQLLVMDWQDFLEWVLENAPEIIEFLMLLISLF